MSFSERELGIFFSKMEEIEQSMKTIPDGKSLHISDQVIYEQLISDGWRGEIVLNPYLKSGQACLFDSSLSSFKFKTDYSDFMPSEEERWMMLSKYLWGAERRMNSENCNKKQL